MSDNLDNILSALGDTPEAEDAPKPEKPTRKRSAPRKKADAKPAPKATAKAAPATEQRGRRGDPAYSQVNANIPNELKASVFFYLKLEGRTLEDVIEEALTAYVEERGGLIAVPAPKRKR